MIFLCPYAYDRMPSGLPRSGVAKERLGSKARIDALYNFVKHSCPQGKEYILAWVLVAGYSKQNPKKATESIPSSLSQDMEDYIKNLNYGFVLGEATAWGTYEETCSIIKKINDCKLSEDQQDIVVSTNIGHMFRVWLCWLFLKPKSWRVRFIPAEHSFTWKERLQETIKFLAYLYRFIFKKW